MTSPSDWMNEARQIAAQCWCDEETSDRVMDPVLAEAVARRIAAWMDTGAFHARNEEYWRNRAMTSEADKRQVAGTHYKKGKPDQEHWNLAIDLEWDFFQYQITKYIMRWKHKAGKQDLEKAAHFLQKYIENWDKFTNPFVEQQPTATSRQESTDAERRAAFVGSSLSYPDDGWAFFEECQAQFLFEGSKEGTNLYRCRRCKEHLTAKNPVRAYEQHGECPGPGYVNQDA